MTTITQNQIEALKGKCPNCNGHDMTIDGYEVCINCKGTGKATIEIEKEKEFETIWSAVTINPSGSEGAYIQIPKYKVGDIIYYCGKCKSIVPICTHKKEWVHKLKILSEIEDKWKVCLI